MVSTAALAETAAAVGDPARANILAALMDGRAVAVTPKGRREIRQAFGVEAG